MFTIYLDGTVVVPLNATENLAVFELANRYYRTCKADENSGKTIWLGVEAELVSEKWKVGQTNTLMDSLSLKLLTKMLNYFFYNQTSDGQQISYNNFKSSNQFGNCAYLFTTTGVGERGRWGDTTCAINSVMR